MAYEIIDECISCGACEAECKNQAISEGETSYVIDPDKCTGCVGYDDSPIRIGRKEAHGHVFSQGIYK